MSINGAFPDVVDYNIATSAEEFAPVFIKCTIPKLASTLSSGDMALFSGRGSAFSTRSNSRTAKLLAGAVRLRKRSMIIQVQNNTTTYCECSDRRTERVT